MELLIRKATSADMPTVHALVMQLAVYENAENEVTTTAADYIKDFEAKKFDVIVAESPVDKFILGMALFYTAYSTWKGNYTWLEDFVVEEAHRGKGVGKKLFDAVVLEANNLNTFLKWQVLDWNEPAINFYNKYATVYQKAWLTCRLGCPIQ